MYNRYIPAGGSYTRVVEEDAPPFSPSPPPTAADTRAPEAQKTSKQPGLAGLLRGLKLEKLDSGDILLLLILLLLFLEGDDTELMITLALLLLLGLDS